MKADVYEKLLNFRIFEYMVSWNVLVRILLMLLHARAWMRAFGVMMLVIWCSTAGSAKFTGILSINIKN
jgi:hypothetical protein